MFCPGVIQHTPDTELAIACLYEQVRPGGWLVFDHYRYNISSFTRTTWLFRAWLKRLPAERRLRAVERLVDRLLPTHRWAARHRAVEMVLNRLSPVTTHFAALPGLSEQQQREWALLNTHDNLTDFYKRHRTSAQLRSTVSLLGATIDEIRALPYTVEVRARRP